MFALIEKAMQRSSVRFLLLVGISFCTNFGLTILLREVLRLPAEVSFAVALVTTFFVNFFGLRYFVYPDSAVPLGTQFLQFLLGTGAFRVTEYLAFLLLHNILTIYYPVAVFVVLVTSSVSKFFFYKNAVFRTRKGKSNT